MDILMPAYCEEFQCIGSACKNTCCQCWTITIDDATRAKYQKIKGEMGERLRKAIDSKGNMVLENQKCPFLNEEKLCQVYIELGEDAMSSICKIFPRVAKMYREYIQFSLTLACPEVVKILLKNKNTLEFKIVDSSKFKGLPLTSIDKKLSAEKQNKYFSFQSLAIDIAQARDISFKHRIMMILMCADKVQKCIDHNQYGKIDEVLAKFADPSYLQILLEQLTTIQIEKESKYESWYGLVKTSIFSFSMQWFEEDEEIYNKYLKDKTKNEIMDFLSKNVEEFDKKMKSMIDMYENIYVHMLFERIMESASDENLMNMVCYLNVCFLVIYLMSLLYAVDNEWQLDEERISLIVSSFYRGLQHSREKREEMRRLLSNVRWYTLPYQMKLLDFDF